MTIRQKMYQDNYLIACYTRQFKPLSQLTCKGYSLYMYDQKIFRQLSITAS